jgi:hypothetical protein
MLEHSEALCGATAVESLRPPHMQAARPMASVKGALGLQLSNASCKLLVAQLLGWPMLLRDVDVAALNRLAVHGVPNEGLR